MTPVSIPMRAPRRPGRRPSLSRTAALVASAAVVVLTSGCDYDSWMDPSRTGYFENTPTSIPVLRKIDVIEVEEDAFATDIGPPRPEDLVPGSPEYVFAAGDKIDVQINDLFQIDKVETFTRTIDQSGRIIIPIVNTVSAAGLTQSELVAEISAKLKNVIPDPRVDVTVLEGRSFNYQVDGQVRNPGVYALNRPDFDIGQAVALAGGVLETGKRIRIVRVVDEAPADALPEPRMTDAGVKSPALPKPGEKPAEKPGPAAPAAPNLDDLIKQIAPAPAAPAPSAPEAAPAPTPAPAPAPAPAPTEAPASPGAMRGPMAVVDPAQLESPKVAEPAVVDPAAGTQAPPAVAPATESRYVFDVQKQEWVLVAPGTAGPAAPVKDLAAPNSPDGAITGPAAASSNPHKLVKPGEYRLPSGKKTRVIIVELSDLNRGNLSLNVIIRPGDKIHVEGDLGVVYIDGEVARPGVFNLPPTGDLTLSRLVTAAGGLGQIAIPQRVDLIRKVAPDREAAIRVNLAAIRNRAEPDIVMRADDHVIIGTNFFATPLAVIRNGFRMTYGFGFLIDRNFGNDVFGPPPVNQFGQ
jgi:protein involved in polysaccharide export with SLBB domain